MRKTLHPTLRYNALLALLLALPFGFGMAQLIESPFAFMPISSSEVQSKAFVVPKSRDALPKSEVAQPVVPLEALPQVPKPLSVASAPSVNGFQVALGFGTLLALGLALVFLARLLWDFWALWRFKKTLVALDVQGLENSLETAMEEVGLRRRSLRWMSSTEETMPMTFGWFRPVVVLPNSVLQQPKALNMVLVHELTHIRRRDYGVHVAARWVQAVFAVHPLVYYMVRQLDEVRELVCDADVLSRTSIPASEYAATLFHLSQNHPATSDRLVPSIGMAYQSSLIFKRIEAMKDFSANPFPQHAVLLILILTLFTAFCMLCVGQTPAPRGMTILGGKQGEPMIEVSEVDSVVMGENETLPPPRHGVVFFSPQFALNGKTISNADGNNTLDNIMFFAAKDKGLFIFSTQPFADSKQAGRIQGNKIVFKLSNKELSITSQEAFWDLDGTPIYAQYDSTYNMENLSLFARDYLKVFVLAGGSAKNVSGQSDDYWGYVRKYEDLYPIGIKPALSFWNPQIRLGEGAFDQASQMLPLYMHITKPASSDILWFRHSSGTFAFSFEPFGGATQTAEVQGNQLAVETPTGTLTIRAKENILNTQQGKVWFAYKESDPRMPPIWTPGRSPRKAEFSLETFFNLLAPKKP